MGKRTLTHMEEIAAAKWEAINWETGRKETTNEYTYRIIFTCSEDDIEDVLNEINAYSNIEHAERTEKI